MNAWSFYGALLSFSVGVAIATVWSISPEFLLLCLLLSFALAVWWRLSLARRQLARSVEIVFLGSLCLAFGAMGLIRTELHNAQYGQSPLLSNLGSEVTLTGTINKEPDYRERTVHLYIQTETDLVLVTTDRYQPFSYGDVVTVVGILRTPEAFTTELGRTFDYPGYLLARGVEFSISFAAVTVIDTGAGHLFLATLYSIKQHFLNQLERFIHEPMAGLGQGVLLGVKQALGEDVERQFRETGIIHIVVLSGYNVMLVVAFILFCFSSLPLTYRVSFGILAIALFALLVGLGATVLRASIMASLVLVAQLLHRRYDVLRGLFVAGFCMLFLNPYLLLYDIGFQLSFMATLGLILLVPHFETAIIKTKWTGLRSFFLATLATQIAVLPLLAYHIGEVSLVSLIVNVIVLPIVPIAMFLTFSTGVVAFFSTPLATVIALPTTWSLQLIILVAEWFSQLPFASVSVPAFGPVVVGLLYLGFGAVYYHFVKPTDSPKIGGWTIEEEAELIQKIKNNEQPKTQSTASLPPIFR